MNDENDILMLGVSEKSIFHCRQIEVENNYCSSKYLQTVMLVKSVSNPSSDGISEILR